MFLQNGSLKVEIPKIRHQSESESGSAVFCRLAGGPDESLNLLVSTIFHFSEMDEPKNPVKMTEIEKSYIQVLKNRI